MKRFSTLTAIIVIAMVISACGAAPAPTANPIDVQNTAIAAAATMVAQTMAAIPTATPLPPTETASPTLPPTNTPLPLPTTDLSILASPTTAPASNASGDPCATRVLGTDLKGRPTKIRIWNTLKYPVVVSIYLNETQSKGECGYRSYNIAKYADVVFDSVQGCYSIWAWSGEGAKEKFNSSGYGCVNNPDKWTFEVNTATVKFVGP